MPYFLLILFSVTLTVMLGHEIGEQVKETFEAVNLALSPLSR